MSWCRVRKPVKRGERIRETLDLIKPYFERAGYDPDLVEVERHYGVPHRHDVYLGGKRVFTYDYLELKAFFDNGDIYCFTPLKN